jgi:orotidine-5'-phosphate decarboxylase
MLISSSHSIIPACDVDLPMFERILAETADIDGVSSYKIGFVLALRYGLPTVVKTARKYTNKPIIYDHQKAATDIPDTGKAFAKVCKDAGVDVVILFPHTGPQTEKEWISAAQAEKLGVIVGGMMSHAMYKHSEGGYIADESIDKIYLLAAECGVTDFVVPGNKPSEIKRIYNLLVAQNMNPTFYSPGFISQGGGVSGISEIVPCDFHAIIGRGIYESENIREVALSYVNQI